MKNRDKVLKLISERGLLRSRELNPHGIARATLSRLVQEGKVRRLARGIYELVDSEPSEHVSLIEVCKRVPQGVGESTRGNL